MASSDIYAVNDPPGTKEPAPPTTRRRRRRQETFDEAVNKDVAKTRVRRSHNSGFRRFRHKMKTPEFSKKFWLSLLGGLGLLLLLLIVWDLFLRYPNEPAGESNESYRVELD